MTMVSCKKLDKNDSELMPIILSAKLLVNGVQHKFTDLTSGALSHLLSPDADETSATDVPAGYINQGSTKLKNISNQTIRLKVDFTENNDNHDVIILPPNNSKNPTYYQGSDKRILEVCLAPGEPITIPSGSFSPLNVTHDGAYLYGFLTNNSGFGVYPLYGSQVDTSQNIFSKVLDHDSDVRFSADGSVLISNKFSLYRTADGFYDLEIAFNPPLMDTAFLDVNPDASYILAGTMGKNVEIYQRQTSTLYQKIGEIAEEDYFTGLAFSQEGDKFSYVTSGNADLKVYSFSQGVATQIGNRLGMADSGEWGLRTLSPPVWLHNNIIVRSYSQDSSQGVHFRGFVDVIRVDADSLNLVTRNEEDLGDTYYRFKTPRNGRVLATTDKNELKLLSVNTSGQIEFTHDYSPLINGYYVLMPSGSEIVTNSSTLGQVDIIHVDQPS
ncbi:hypothetical protein 2F1_24 [Uncultured Caudovirales phage clone 2F_1]|uniref:Uncharacterized protein n=1 Tax=Uncultured Caudovirales phage clone 2F_1 TaxID=2992576 RepID=A0A2H4J8Q2_9CAUD|nr:hypothetical protein [Acinetobacter radioresistens]YP_010092452.1 hypothetical protein KNT73_gp24 [Uncultured Caudovirales phage clone 2F_1]ASN71625.1 hypothetical protein 2F1_24 [Uncultured Caudovirales phage clone 2F_1]RJL74422.1 hypothetical protein D5055_02795 [Acinetobacter radioresistens]